MTPRRFRSSRTAGAFGNRSDSWAPRASGSAGVRISTPCSRRSRLEVAGQADRALAQGRHADLVEDRERRRQRHHVEERRGRHLPGGGTGVGDERPVGIEPMVGRGTPPAGQARHVGAGPEMPLVDEDRADRARSAVEVLVRAPDGEIDVVVVERERDVAGGVRELPADDRPDLVGRRRQPPDRQRLTGREVDAVEQDEREARAVLGDRALEVLDADRVLARPRARRPPGPSPGPARARRGGS